MDYIFFSSASFSSAEDLISSKSDRMGPGSTSHIMLALYHHPIRYWGDIHIHITYMSERWGSTLAFFFLFTFISEWMAWDGVWLDGSLTEKIQDLFTWLVHI